MFSRLAGIPQGIWLTPEEYPAGQVGPFVSGIVAAADDAGQVPTFVVYGIPDRDCSGGFSEGGLPADQYLTWVTRSRSPPARGTGPWRSSSRTRWPPPLECDRTTSGSG